MGYLDLYSQSYISSSGPEYQLANQWIMQFENFEAYDFIIQESNLPLFTLSTEKVNMDLIVPGKKDEYRTFSITFRETRNFEGFKFHWNWFNSIYDFEKRLVKKGFHNQKKKATIKFISSYNNLSQGSAQIAQVGNLIKTGLDKISKSETKRPKKELYSIIQNQAFELIGIQLTGIEDVSLDNESGDPLTFTVNYEIQRVIPIIGSEQIR